MRTLRKRPPLNAFGIAFGLAGLAGAWTEATRSLASPQFIAETLWVVAMVVWLTTVIIYVSRLRGWGDLSGDLQHSVLGPFAALVPIPPMLWGAHMAATSTPLGVALVVVCVTASSVFGVWFISQLLTVSRGFGTVHSGYFLPSVAAALLSAQSLAVIGQKWLALGLLGVGLLFWLLIGGAVLARLMAGPDILGALVPTLGIFSAPPAVAGNAWWVISGGQGGAINALLAGAMVAVVAPHFFLAGRYARLPFALGFWALTFTAAASATFALRLFAMNDDAWSVAAAWVVVALATVFIAAVATRSLALLRVRRSDGTVPISPALGADATVPATSESAGH
jgi:tellurite resistance protein